jgi:hypothetical protein
MMNPSYRAMVRRGFDALLDIGPRPHGSRGSELAAEWVGDALRGLGLNVEEVPFVAPTPRENDDALLSVLNESAPPIACKAFLETAGGVVEGPLRFHGLTYVWGIHEWKVWRIGEQEAIGYIASRVEGPMITQHLPEDSAKLPHAVVGPETAATLDLLARRGAHVRLEMTTPEPPVGGVSLLAYRDRSPYRAGPARPLILGHYDTVPNTPGAYDNAAGAAAVLACAMAVANGEIDANILVTGGEEVGLAGARSFVGTLRDVDRLDAISLAINLDGGGRGRQFEAWIGPENLQDLLARPLAETLAGRDGYELIYRHPAPPGSDHQAFREAGLPAVMLSVNDLEILHTPDDVWDEDKLANAELLAESAMAVVKSFAG